MQINQKRSFEWLLMVIILSIFVMLFRPIALDVVDSWNCCHMTADESRDSMELPFKLSKPPVGKNHMLNRSQVRWILVMEIRMDEMKSMIHHDNEAAVREFTEMVEDFNARAASYRCETADFQGASKDVEECVNEIKQRAAADVKKLEWDCPRYED